MLADAKNPQLSYQEKLAYFKSRGGIRQITRGGRWQTPNSG
jgi:hypothetical protein